MTEHAVVIAGGRPTGLMLAGELASESAIRRGCPASPTWPGASLPMAMAINMPPPAVTLPPINLADDPGCGRKLGACA